MLVEAKACQPTDARCSLGLLKLSLALPCWLASVAILECPPWLQAFSFLGLQKLSRKLKVSTGRLPFCRVG